MKRYMLFATATALLANCAVYAQEITQTSAPAPEQSAVKEESLAVDIPDKNTPPNAPKPTLKANLRRVSLDFSSTSVNNANEYTDSPISDLSADSKTVLMGVFDFALEYNRSNLQWNNSLYMEYGQTKTEPADGSPTVTSEDADKILLSSDYAHKIWKWDHIDAGPMAVAEYETEFEPNGDAPRRKVLRGKGGIKLFGDSFVKSLYLALVEEYDMTYSDNKTSKFAGEVGWRLEHELREGVKVSTDGYYRDYWTYSTYVAEDLKYDLLVKGRMDVALYGKLAIGPYISYRMAQSRGAEHAGSNFQVGLSLSYNDIFDLKK